MNTIKRPFVVGTIYFIIGIIGGTLWIENLQVPFWVLVGLVICMGIIKCIYYKKMKYSLFILIYIAGVISVMRSGVIKELEFISGESIIVTGVIKEYKEGPYNNQIHLESVNISNLEGWQRIKSELIIISRDRYDVGDLVVVQGKVLPSSIAMNPADFDYASYLRNNGILARVEAKEIKVIEESVKSKTLSNRRQALVQQNDAIYQGRDFGIMSAVLFGEKSNIEETRELYNELGIGHLFAISGFHVGVIAGAILWLLMKLGLDYYRRRIISIIVIWGYCFLVGGSLSTIRACILLTTIMIGRCIWEEEDPLTLLAVAATIILVLNPFNLYHIGFQLSFLSVTAVILSQDLKDYYEEERKMPSYVWAAMSILAITLMISPVLAYHFFFVPVLGNLLNLIFIPIFALLIPIGIIVFFISLVSLNAATLLGYPIIYVLQGMNVLAQIVRELPVATICIGRPSMLQIMIYYVVMITGYLIIKGRINRQKVKKILMAYAILTIIGLNAPSYLEVTQLYVGQGDAAIISLPTQEVIIIDGGNRGWGKTVKNNLNYMGKNEVEAIFVSHPHEDHIGGVLDLLEEQIRIKSIIVSTMALEDPLMDELANKCYLKNIPIYAIESGVWFEVGGVEIICLSPNEKTSIDANESSLVLCLKYKDVNVLYTGDIGKETEQIIEWQKADVVKVAHHGSKTSTSESFLLQTRPEYGMISCGKNNLYNHPHQETVDRLNEHDIQIMNTNVHGAITMVTDGEYIKVKTQIQEE